MPPSVALKALDILPVCLSWTSLLLHLPPPPKWMTATNGSANHKSRPWTGPGMPPPRAIKLPRNRWPIKPGPGDGGRWDPPRAIPPSTRLSPRVDSGCVRVMSKLRSNHVSEVRGSGGVSVSTTVDSSLPLPCALNCNAPDPDKSVHAEPRSRSNLGTYMDVCRPGAAVETKPCWGIESAHQCPDFRTSRHPV